MALALQTKNKKNIKSFFLEKPKKQKKYFANLLKNKDIVKKINYIFLKK